MALLSFPPTPYNGEIYPVNPPAGVNIYIWDSTDSTWRLIGPASGVVPGTYGTSTFVPQITIDATGRITVAQNVQIQLGTTTQVGLVQLVDDTTSNDPTKALTAAMGFRLAEEIGDVSQLNPFYPDLVTAINAINTPTGVVPGTYGTSTTVSQFTVNAQGRITSATNVPLALATTTSPGVVRVGANLEITGLGILSVPNSSTSVRGVSQLATNAQVQTGTDSLTVVTPAALQSKLSSSVSSTSTTTIADSASVKIAYDAALAAQAAATSIQYKQFDDISGMFDNVLTTFILRIGGVATAPTPSSNLMVFLGGVAQIPGAPNAYTVAGSVITFSTAPAAGTTFYATTIGAP